MPEGRIDTVTAPEFEQAIKDVLPGIKTLRLDFGKLDYISSAGLRVILFAQKAMNSQGDMVICNAKDEIKEIFDITGFSDILTIE